jgi:hydrogenase nickel incorporation protein HypA/HybF
LLSNCQLKWGNNPLGVENFGRNSAMHEISIMAEAVRMAAESAQAAGAKRVIVLHLRVGVLSGAVPEAMQFAWDVVRRDTMLAGARLEIESVAAACWCATCRAEFAASEFLSECPRCHDLSGDLRRGREMEIAAMELE